MSTEVKAAPSHPKDQPPAHAAGDAEEESASTRTEDAEQAKPDDEASPPGQAELIREEVLDNAERTDAEKRALDAALTSFGFPTNQQINILGRHDTVAVHDRKALSEHTLTRVRSAFVVSADYRPARVQLLATNLMLLSGRAGSGRECLSMHILDALCDGQVDHLVGGRLGELDVGSLDPGAGYLWTGVAGPWEPADADQLVEALRRIDAKMIIVCSDGDDMPFQLGDLCYALNDSLDNSRVLDRHLRADDDEATPDMAILLADPEVRSAVARLGGAGEAAALGRALRDVLAGRCALQVALIRASEMANWFVRLPEREDRAFALALAALDNLSFPTVVSGARRMDEIIQETEDPEHRSSIRTWARPTRQLLAAVDAQCRQHVITTSARTIPTTVVASNRNLFPQTMLRTLWREFPYLQQVYLDWLTELVESPDPNVRERAAMAASVLAVDDFNFIRSRLLDGWACDQKRELRRSAAIALRAPATDATLTDVVWDLLDDWATVDGSDRANRHMLQLTAATALGGPVGATDCGRALDIITRRLLDWSPGRYQYKLWAAVTVAIVELFGDGSSEQSSSVLTRLVKWAGADRNGPRDVAIAATVAIATQPPMPGLQDQQQSVPLLRAVATDADNLSRTATLCRLAVNDRVMAETAVRSLLRLADNTQEHDETTLLRLIRAVPQTSRERRTLRYEFLRRSETDPSPSIFDRLTDLLEGLA